VKQDLKCMRRAYQVVKLKLQILKQCVKMD
jgi:hypothetical protein